MRKTKKAFWLLAAAMSFFIGSCSNSSPSEPVNQSDDPAGSINYYDEDNFVKSDRIVTQTKVVTYDGPQYFQTSNKVDISVNDNPLFVYETRVNSQRKFSWETPETTVPLAIFDFEGKVHIKLDVKEGNVSYARVSPLVYGIEPTVKGNTIEFDLEYNDNYTVEVNGDSNRAIHLFANEIEEHPITAEEAEANPNITYIGPGVYKADAIPVESNKTIYLAGGAYVYGQIRTEGLENVTIRGRGIISGSIYTRKTEDDKTIPVEIRTSENVTLEGITFLDPAGWTIVLYKSNNITLNNIKIVTARQNGDGISVQSSSNVMVKGGFVRTWDDSLVVKNVDRGSTNHVTFDGVNVWTDLAQSMEVGYETNGPTMNDINFKNITIVHNFHKAAISLHNCDDATITNVTYQNITLEDGQMLGDDREDNDVEIGGRK